jgi:hypothetical protein
MNSVRVFDAILVLCAPGLAANASAASQREYKRGYDDCAAGRYDQNQHGASHKKGCRAAEDAAGSAPAGNLCPADVSEANRYPYPACN